MNLRLALATAEQQISPNFQGTRFPDSGIYRVNNGQYMTGSRDSLPYRLAKHKWTFAEFVAAHRIGDRLYGGVKPYRGR